MLDILLSPKERKDPSIDDRKGVCHSDSCHYCSVCLFLLSYFLNVNIAVSEAHSRQGARSSALSRTGQLLAANARQILIHLFQIDFFDCR